MARNVSLTYYDRIIAAIAISLGGGVLVSVATELQFRVGLLGGALVATIFVYDAMFRNPPRPVPRQAKAAAIVWHVFLAVLLVLPYL